MANLIRCQCRFHLFVKLCSMVHKTSPVLQRVLPCGGSAKMSVLVFTVHACLTPVVCDLQKPDCYLNLRAHSLQTAVDSGGFGPEAHMYSKFSCKCRAHSQTYTVAV